MKKIDAVIKPFKLKEVIKALTDLGLQGMTVSEARGYGCQKGHPEVYHGSEYTIDFIAKVKVEVVVADKMVKRAIFAIVTAAKTGKIGDGKVFVSQVEEAIRIRTSEAGEYAI